MQNRIRQEQPFLSNGKGTQVMNMNHQKMEGAGAERVISKTTQVPDFQINYCQFGNMHINFNKVHSTTYPLRELFSLRLVFPFQNWQ